MEVQALAGAQKKAAREGRIIIFIDEFRHLGTTALGEHLGAEGSNASAAIQLHLETVISGRWYQLLEHLLQSGERKVAGKKRHILVDTLARQASARCDRACGSRNSHVRHVK